jgi:hypothetical protein
MKQSRQISSERIVLLLSGLQLIAVSPTATCCRAIKTYSSTKTNPESADTNTQITFWFLCIIINHCCEGCQDILKKRRKEKLNLKELKKITCFVFFIKNVPLIKVKDGKY